MKRKKVDLAPIPGIRIGHAQDDAARTGCSVILCEEGAVAGYDLRGSAPGTRETDLLRPGMLVERVHAVLLTGGSAFGLAAADGVMRYLEERGKGYNASGVRVPIVPAAVIFDLHVGRADVRPDAAMGYRACTAAGGSSLAVGQVGAGTGATVGKILGMDHCMNGGLGYAHEILPSGVVVAALVVVNALGDVVDPAGGTIAAGARKPEGGGFLDTAAFVRQMPVSGPLAGENTTLAVVMTDARFTKEQTGKLARMAQNGLARTLRPVHTMYDGDLVFALAAGGRQADVNVVGTVAADCVSRAILQAVRVANGDDA